MASPPHLFHKIRNANYCIYCKRPVDILGSTPLPPSIPNGLRFLGRRCPDANHQLAAAVRIVLISH